MIGTPVSPYVYNELGIHVEVHFDNATLALANPAITGTREVTCPWTKIQIGDATKQFPLPDGPFSVSRAQAAAKGFNTYDDIRNTTFTLVA